MFVLKLFLDKFYCNLPVSASRVVASVLSFVLVVSSSSDTSSSPDSFCVPCTTAYKSNATLSMADITVVLSPSEVGSAGSFSLSSLSSSGSETGAGSGFSDFLGASSSSFSSA